CFRLREIRSLPPAPLQSEPGPRLRWRRDPAAMPMDGLDGELDQLRIARGELLPRDPDIVFQSGANGIRAAGERPIHDFGLMTADSRRSPRRLRQDSLEFPFQDVEQALVSRHGVL